jgi:hypothetical protein
MGDTNLYCGYVRIEGGGMKMNFFSPPELSLIITDRVDIVNPRRVSDEQNKILYPALTLNY